MLTRRKHHVCRKLHFQRWFQAYDDLLKRDDLSRDHICHIFEIIFAVHFLQMWHFILGNVDVWTNSADFLCFYLVNVSLLLNYYQSSWQSEAERLELPLGGFRAGAYSFHFHRKICLTILFVFRMLDVSRWIEDAVGFCFFLNESLISLNIRVLAQIHIECQM